VTRGGVSNDVIGGYRLPQLGRAAVKLIMVKGDNDRRRRNVDVVDVEFETRVCDGDVRVGIEETRR
jgi:methyl coenzyme M reductase subunit D